MGRSGEGLDPRWIDPIALVVAAGITLVAAPGEETSEHADREALRTLIRSAISRRATEADASVPESIQRWTQTHRQSLEGLRPAGLEEQPWGLSALRPAITDGGPPLLYLYVFDWHASGKLIVYGLTGGVKRAYLLSDADRADLPVGKRDRSTVLSVPKDAPDLLASVVVLELEGKLETSPLAVQPADDGRIVLHARDAIVHGRTLRYEPEPHKNTVGYWTDPRDSVSWPFHVINPGTYKVDILQGCGKGSGGSTVEFAVDDKQVLKVTVQDTGGFQNFVNRPIGQFHFARPGRYTLTVKATHKPGLAVMDLRKVTLTAVE